MLSRLGSRRRTVCDVVPRRPAAARAPGRRPHCPTFRAASARARAAGRHFPASPSSDTRRHSMPGRADTAGSFSPAGRAGGGARDRGVGVHRARARRTPPRSRREDPCDSECRRAAVHGDGRRRRGRLRARRLDARAAQESRPPRRRFSARRSERLRATRRRRARLGRHRAHPKRRRALAGRGLGRRARPPLPRGSVCRIRLRLRRVRAARARGDGMGRRSWRRPAPDPRVRERVIMVDPRDADAIAAGSRGRGAGRARARRSRAAAAYDWARVARETIAVYREVAE